VADGIRSEPLPRNLENDLALLLWDLSVSHPGRLQDSFRRARDSGHLGTRNAVPGEFDAKMAMGRWSEEGVCNGGAKQV